MSTLRRFLLPLALGSLIVVISSCSSRRAGPEYGEFPERRTPANVVTAAQIQNFPGVSTVEEILVRLVPGVVLTSAGVEIMGLSGRPLWVIDGVPLSVQGGLVPVSPTNVERMEVVRDGAETAAYGFRGGSGVIVIQTKRGS